MIPLFKPQKSYVDILNIERYYAIKVNAGVRLMVGNMKIKTIKYKQKGKNVYVFTADPNYIVKLVGIKDISKSDENFQRPYDEKRIEEIRQYVLGHDKLYKKGKDINAKGYIPNAIVLNLSKKYTILEENGETFIDFPEEKDLEVYDESIEVIDGQHRLLAFNDECKKHLAGEPYEMCFVALLALTSDEKKEIFMVLNERQKTVDKNILLRHKKLLHLLLEEEETRYEVISRLNSETDSPFSGRIIMSGEKIPHGIKATQIDEVLCSSKAMDKLTDSQNQISDKNYKKLKNYYEAWKNNYKDIWFKKNNTMTKIAGIRFITLMFPYIHEVLSSKGDGKDFRVDAFSTIVKEIKDSHFNDEFDIKKANKFDYFQQRRGIEKLATQIGKELIEENKAKDSDILV